MKRMQLTDIKMDVKYYTDEMYNIKNCGEYIQDIKIEHIYYDGVHNHVIATLPNGLTYKYYGSFTCDLVDELNAFIQGFNKAVELLD